MPNDSEFVISSDNAALRLGLSKGTLAKWRLSGQGPEYIKLGRRVVYREADINLWLESRKRRSTSQSAGYEN